MLVKYRKTLDQRIHDLKNSIRSLFANRGIEIARGARAWYTGREQINSYRKPLADCEMEELWQGQLDLELKQLDALAEELAEVEKRLEVIAKADDRIRRLQTIPGVGRKTAEAFVTVIDDADRFENARQVSAYIGLVPRQYQSGETDRNGRITKRGSRLLSRCVRIDLSRRGLAETLAKRAREIAQTEGLDGKPLEAYVKLAKDCRRGWCFPSFMSPTRRARGVLDRELVLRVSPPGKSPSTSPKSNGLR
jgi:transposase